MTFEGVFVIFEQQHWGKETCLKESNDQFEKEMHGTVVFLLKRMELEGSCHPSEKNIQYI